MWKSNTDFDLAPESAIIVERARIKDLRGRNNDFINMIYP
jgi:hypothetical protein